MLQVEVCNHGPEGSDLHKQKQNGVVWLPSKQSGLLSCLNFKLRNEGKRTWKKGSVSNNIIS